jgi:hypothetical protein
MKEVIKNYLEEQCKVDPCLAEKYKDTLLNGCIEYINKMAREELGGKSGAIKDDVVFHWAREYYVDGIAEKEYDKKVKEQLKKISDLSKVKVDNDMPEERKEHLREVLAKVRAMKQQELDF